MNHSDNLNAFATTFKAMKESLIKWALTKGGVINDGCMNGLSENDNTHFEVRNKQLEILSTYSASAETRIQELETEIKRLKDRNILLETASREQIQSDETVKTECDRLLKYTIDDETTFLEFEGIVKNTVFYLNLGLKRNLIENTEGVQKKLIGCNYMLNTKGELKRIFDIKKSKLFHESIKTTIQATPSN